MSDEDDLDPVDREALERAVAEMSRDAVHGNQIRWALASREWIDAAILASFFAQVRNLNLRPWDTAVVDACEGDGSPASRLLARLLQAGLSRFEPDPIAALEAAARTSTKRGEK